MAGSFETRDAASTSDDAFDEAMPSSALAKQRVLWMGRGAAPLGLTQVMSSLGCLVSDRSEGVWPAQRVSWLSQVSAAARVHRSLGGRRIAVIHPDPGASDALAEALRARGAQVVVLSLGEAGLDRAEALDPEVIVMQPD